jgi:hypothetical protein
MTGNRRDEGTGPGRSGPDQSADCKFSYEGARFVAPQNLDNVHQGEWLNLVVREINGAPVLHAKTRLGVEIGAISSRSTGEIIHCMDRGYVYGAQVITLDGGDSNLTITMMSSP